MPAPKKILIDCDPGIDDALAITLAHGCEALDLVGITTVGGNVSLDLTTANALKLREYLGFPAVPVVAGSAGALVISRIDAAEVHGFGGLGGAVLPEPRLNVNDGHAIDFIIDTLAASPGEISLTAVGPLTNIALAVRKEPRIVEWAREFVILGGSYTRGNRTPAAEFNIAADPEAAAIVFGAGWTVNQIGLDVSLTALATGPVLARMRDLGRLGGELLIPALEFYGMTTAHDGPAVHDALAIAYVADPSLFEFTPAVVDVETVGRFTSGMTVTDFNLHGRMPNANVARSIDVARFWELTLDSFARVSAQLP
ncbi:nucleoside hydrolase [Herbidospora mongoliensis]|uniref:nucleoside hydrolase n=1 Tax=Herbidospora mongoliensis TaxID=688067 RepID=UPI00082C46C1|nr:nucleoside hydrolase [Herbidospora mongoliensis]